MNMAEVVEFIYGATPDELHTLNEAIRGALRAARRHESSVAIVALKVGDKVRLSGLSPQYVNGSTGTIVKRLNTKLLVRFDEGTDQRILDRFGSQARVPASSLTKVEA